MPRAAPRIHATVTVVGKDRTGVVARVTSFLFGSGANIEALEEQVTRGQFSMSLAASWPTDAAPRERVAAALARIGRELRMETRVRWARPPGAKRRVAIFVTKESHALDALLAAMRGRRPRVAAEPVLVVANRRDLAGAAKRAKLPFLYVDWRDRAASEAKVLAALDAADVDFLVLARFMKILSPEFCWRWRNKIINIHPSLLPSFPGASAYRQAYERGVRVVGVTAHFVTPDLDQGPIIHQDAFRVRPSDGVAEIVRRGQALEAKVLVEAVRLYLTKRLDVHWGRVWSG